MRLPRQLPGLFRLQGTIAKTTAPQMQERKKCPVCRKKVNDHPIAGKNWALIYYDDGTTMLMHEKLD